MLHNEHRRDKKEREQCIRNKIKKKLQQQVVQGHKYGSNSPGVKRAEVELLPSPIHLKGEPILGCSGKPQHIFFFFTVLPESSLQEMMRSSMHCAVDTFLDIIFGSYVVSFLRQQNDIKITRAFSVVSGCLGRWSPPQSKTPRESLPRCGAGRLTDMEPA